MNRHSLDKKCLHQTPRRWKRRTYGAGPSAVPARSPPGASVSLPPSIPSSFLLALLLFTRVFSSRLSTPQVLRKTPSLARLAPFLLLLSASSVSLCILCVSPFYSFSNPYPARRAGCPSPPFTSHNGSLPHFSSIIPHYYFAPTHCFLSSSLVPHPLHPYTSSQSSPLTLYNVTSPSPYLPPILMNSSSIFPPFPDRFA